MPLKSGSSNKTKSRNIKEITKSYKETGKIGTSTPETKEKARKQAVAIAYSEADKSKKKKKKPINEALESFELLPIEIYTEVDPEWDEYLDMYEMKQWAVD